MSEEEQDLSGLQASILPAREQVEFAAKFVETASAREDWDSHRPVVELVFYLCRIDYDIKVLLYQLLNDAPNRSVWEPYLALELHEQLRTVPKAINHARMDLASPHTASRLDVGRFDSAAKMLIAEIKVIRSDNEFMNGLSMIRNGVAAHHGFSKGKRMDESIAWFLSITKSAASGKTPFESQIAEYSLKFGRAIQRFAQSIQSQ